MNLDDMHTRLADFFGNASDTAFYTRILNDVYDQISGKTDWWWMESETVLTFAAPISTDTSCTVTQATADITTSASLAAGYDEGWAVSGAQAYRITAISGTAVTLDSNWIEATSTAQSMTFWNDMLDLPSDFDHAKQLTCRNDPNHMPVQQVELEEIEKFGPDVSSWQDEHADRFAIFRDAGRTSTFRIRIFPPPDATAEYTLRYRTIKTALSATSDVALVPEKFHPVLVDGAIARICKMEREAADVWQMWETSFQQGLREMRREQHKRGNVQRKFKRRGAVSDTKRLPFKTYNTAGGV